MENRKRIFGIRRSIVISVHKIMFVIMLQSSFLGSSQQMLSDYFNNDSAPLFYKGSKLIDSDENNAGKSNDANSVHKTASAAVHAQTAETSFGKDDYSSFNADIAVGIIGVSNENPLDDPADNLFKFVIKDLLSTNSRVYLTYELYGVNDQNAVSRSINERPAIGGYLVNLKPEWSSQREEIDPRWLKQGENHVMFATPKGANYQYKIKNLKIEVKIATAEALPAIVLNNPQSNLTKEGRFYIKGFIRNNTVGSDVKIFVDQEQVVARDGEFEGFVTLSDAVKGRKFAILNAQDNKGLLGQEILQLDLSNQAERVFPIETNTDNVTVLIEAGSGGNLKADGASIVIAGESFTQAKEISIVKLRNIDIAPLSSGMINVTKGGYGYRFFPDGIKFSKPATIAIEYDEKLIPHGYNANDIKTFYFNTTTKSWVAIKRDTIDSTTKSIVSLTDHFTDYINGIIQTPDSPETAAFTSTMMNDIKAADPSSEMTLISPPEVSQTGEANINYPIKLPAGTRGMQPNLSVHYSNEAGNGPLGVGWNIGIPAISIDSRWGVPVFEALNETVIYTLAGEQLMYPKYNSVDWMPNRHYDTATSTGTQYNTKSRPKIAPAAAIFTMRKQGGFSKMERLGSTPATYYWKVTDGNGSISWYGGKDQVINGYVLKNADDNIVHWALYMTQDVFGNNIKYLYDKSTLTSVSSEEDNNLLQGQIFRISKIFYTGVGTVDGPYLVQFNYTTTLRNDVSINARLGIKQIEPYFLSNIIVKKSSQTTNIRKYVFNMGTGKFGKGQLKYISEVDKSDKELSRNTLSYYDDLKSMFSNPKDITLPNISPSFA